MFEAIEEAQKDRAGELETKLSQAQQDYYNGSPTITDEVYDAWLDELRGLKADSPVLAAVGAKPVSEWVKVRHTIPMGSLNKVNEPEELAVWVEKTKRLPNLKKSIAADNSSSLVVSEKLDGISISLQFVEGKLVQALTRGDGETGEDITSNVVQMKGIPAKLAKPINAFFRGEIVLLKSDHRKHFPEMANPRNAASGTAKRMSGDRAQHLTVMCYEALEAQDNPFQLDVEMFNYIEAMGLQTPGWYGGLTLDMVMGLRGDYEDEVRENLDYEIDGLVIRYNDQAHVWALGEHNGRPKGAVAFKFAAVMQETVALERIDQVGGSGRITPVAVFKQVNLVGANITRASLYNQAYVEKIGFDVGAKILVARANDVIPRVESVVEGTGSVSQAPTNCPECDTETEMDGEYVICPNVSGCPAQTVGRLHKWVTKTGIMEWGTGLIERVVEAGLAKTVPDLYRITVEQLTGLERMAATSAKTAYDELRKVLPLPLETFVGSLGIPLCGRSTLRLVVDAGFDSVSMLVMSAYVESLTKIPGMGEKRAKALRKWLNENEALLGEMIDVGITIKERAVGSLTGKTLCFTGKSKLKRVVLQKFAEDAGGTVKKSVGKGLSFLVLADPNSGSSKAKAARKNGTECVSEESFLEMVGYDG